MTSRNYRRYLQADRNKMPMSPAGYLRAGVYLKTALASIKRRHAWGGHVRTHDIEVASELKVKECTVENWSLDQLSVTFILEDNSCVHVSSQAYTEWALLDGDDTELSHRPDHMGFITIVHRAENECTLVQ